MPALLTQADYIAHLGRDLDALLTHATDPTVAVPNCPGWTVEELTSHLAGTCRWATANLVAPAGSDLVRHDAVEAPPGAGPDVLRAAGDEALEVMGRTDASEHRPNWGGAETALFWYRRLALETAVHRFDVVRAAGSDPEPVDALLAEDGIEEFADVFLRRAKRWGMVGDGDTVHLHATDADTLAATGEWMYTFTEDGVEVSHEHGKGDMAVRGSASDLFLFVWNRRPIDVQCFGDPDPLAWWPERVRI